MGRRMPRLLRPWAVARCGVSLVWRRRLLKLMILVGWLPFAVASGLYIAGFSAWFLLPAVASGPARFRSVAFVVLFAAIAATAISALFQYGFLVRLP